MALSNSSHGSSLGNQSRHLGKRVLTGVIVFPILMLLVWVDGIWLTITAVSIVFGGLNEIFSMAKIPRRSLVRAFTAVWAAVLFWAIGSGELGGRQLLLVSFGSYGAAFAALFTVLVLRQFKSLENFEFRFVIVFSVTLLTLSMASAINLRQEDNGRSWMFVALLIPMAVDTGSYFVGGKWGTRKLAPRISPGKTWEGAAGGLIVGILALMGLNYSLDLGLGYQSCMVLGFAISSMAQIGDLLESSLKRLFGAKDSGKLFPGHGGILDRIDSLVLIFPLVYYVQSVWLT